MANTFKRMEKKTTLPTERVEELKARIAMFFKVYGNANGAH